MIPINWLNEYFPNHINIDDTKTQSIGLAIDSRNIKPNEIFVALRGKVGGHNYLNDLLAKGAVGALVEQFDPTVPLAQWQTTSSQIAMHDIAIYKRQTERAKRIGITGSVGKTTVKELIAHMLLYQYSVLKTEGNFNNHLGVPITLSRLNNEDYAVIEMGANRQGDIAELTTMSQPDIRLITRSGQAHIEGFGSFEKLCETKGEIIDTLPDNSTIILPIDDAGFSGWSKRLSSNQNLVTFSISNPNATLHALKSKTGITIATPQEEVALPIKPDDVLLYNILAACSALYASHLALQIFVDQLIHFKSPKGRCSVVNIDNIELIDDTYNASPESVESSLKLLGRKEGKKRIFVFGGMAELGKYHDHISAQCADIALMQNIDTVFCYTDRSYAFYEHYQKEKQGISFHNDYGAMLEQIYSQCSSNEPIVILIKGSRSSEMDKVSQMLARYLNNLI